MKYLLSVKNVDKCGILNPECKFGAGLPVLTERLQMGKVLGKVV